MTKLMRGYLRMHSAYQTKRGSVPCLSTELNLALTLHGGQSFR